ncbi:MAG: phosphoribulokinase [Gammaproteobacteria bacterium]|nr:phosphoribulokinase [Gammaproteobacteria bacterium]
MSEKHPIISITGSSGAGTSTIKHTFEYLFFREGVNPCYIEGDAFHRYSRLEMKEAMKQAEEEGDQNFSHFGPKANLFKELESVFKEYSETGGGKTRHYIHDEGEALRYDVPPGEFTNWEPLPDETDLLFYEGLHGAVKTDEVDIAQHADLKIGVVPVTNLEWIQKIHRDSSARGYSAEAVTDTILRRMPDYINYICPQFTHTDINFQRVPTVDTSNPFIARWVPTADESMVVIRFANPRGINFPYLISMIHDSYMSRSNTIVVPGGKMDIAMQLIFTPMVMRLVENKRKLR